MKAVLVCVLSLTLLTGCGARGWLPYAREMGDTALVRTLGLDDAGGQVELTVSTGGETGGEGALVLSARGASIPSAALEVQSQGDRYIYYGHVDQLVLGEGWAMGGVSDLLDYLAREAELGLGVQLWVVRGGGAGEAIRAAGTRGVSERLAQLNTDSGLGAANITRTAAQLMAVLARRGSTYLPALALTPAREGDGEDGAEKVLRPEGYAILRRGKLVGWAEGDAARGIELMEGQVFGQVADLTLSDGTEVSLTLTGANTTCRPAFRAGELVGLEVVCTVTARVAQTQRRLTQDELNQLRQKLEWMLGERVVQALGLGQHWDADYLWLEQRVRMARPDQKKTIQEQWQQAFRALDIRVEVQGKVERSLGMMDAAR